MSQYKNLASVVHFDESSSNSTRPEPAPRVLLRIRIHTLPDCYPKSAEPPKQSFIILYQRCGKAPRSKQLTSEMQELIPCVSTQGKRLCSQLFLGRSLRTTYVASWLRALCQSSLTDMHVKWYRRIRVNLIKRLGDRQIFPRLLSSGFLAATLPHFPGRLDHPRFRLEVNNTRVFDFFLGVNLDLRCVVCVALYAFPARNIFAPESSELLHVFHLHVCVWNWHFNDFNDISTFQELNIAS
ncbi:hypothetical protein L218DRAFT_269758 [Marasmius fiardii PR-910]|nr:hypothetical protein L218DRAFT_269758 [Marasmius fiardii PR-910]